MMLTLVCAAVAFYISKADNYDENAARTALYYAYGSYCPSDSLENWDCKWCEQLPHFSIDTVATTKSTELEAFTGYNSKSRQIVISFRGTKNIKNILLDFEWNQMYFKDGDKYNEDGGSWGIHKGFYEGLYELFEEGLEASLKDLFTRHKGANVLITGHSMGGALAQMLALMFRTVPLFEPLSIGHVNIITFGAPRWGSKAVVTYFNGLSHTNWRIVNAYDIIPTMPGKRDGKYGYYQSKKEVEYTEFGALNYQLCDGDGEVSSNCSYTSSWNLKYHNYYLTIYEDACGTRAPKCRFGTRSLLETYSNCTDDEQFAQPKSTDTSKSSDDWVVWSLIGVGCVLVVAVFCYFVMKLYRHEKHQTKKDDDGHYLPITDKDATGVNL